MIYIFLSVHFNKKKNSYDLIGNSTTILWFANNYFCLHIIICQQTNNSYNLTLYKFRINIKDFYAESPTVTPKFRVNWPRDLSSIYCAPCNAQGNAWVMFKGQVLYYCKTYQDFPRYFSLYFLKVLYLRIRQTLSMMVPDYFRNRHRSRHRYELSGPIP